MVSQISILLLLLLCAPTFHSTGTNLQPRCNEKDRSSLQIFKRGVVNHSNKLPSWSTDQDCCAWKGVHCDNTTGRVTRLDLKQQYLEGDIDLSLFQIQFLSYLDLSLNGFTTLTAPYDTHATFSYLHFLDLSFNDDLHVDNLLWLSQLSSLKYLNLSQINLQNQTNWLHSMALHPSLLELRLASSHLTNINIIPPMKCVNFSSLLTLDLSGNHFLSELPSWLFNLTSVSHIDLSFNFIHGPLPKSLLSLRNLKSLRLNNNELDGSIPEWIGQHEHLQYLGLVDNMFHGSIPSSIGNLSSLIELEISSNSLSGNLPTSFGKLFNLRSLTIGGDSLSGVLHENHFSNLSNLEALVLSAPFSFDLASDWMPPFQLKGISLKNANLGPKFPEWIYTQNSLVYLEVPNSNISSINSDMFWRLVSNITQLNLSKNRISADLTNITLNTELMFMDNNNFTGELPHITTNVVYLDLSHNSFYGPISPLFCHNLGRENSLDYLDISSNLLTGGVPDCWEYWKGLSFLFMESNMLTGEVPPSMGSFVDLIALDLHNNSLAGNFSLDLSNITNLEFINIKDNNFSGTVPTKMPHSMEVMLLGSNQFEGNIPPKICNLSSLIQLDLYHNKLSGSIPPCISDIPSMGGAQRTSHYPFEFNLYNKGLELEYEDYGLLRTLDLSFNNLSGEIPPQVFNLVQLQSLNLSRNHFTGEISRDIGSMKNLESLDLSSNKLHGEIPVSISSLSFLSFLNLSYNDFTGQIPVGTQLQSFNAANFAGNPGLCGAPLPFNCTKESVSVDVTNQHGGSNDDGFETESLYLGMGVGFAVGFWGLCGSIFLNRTWRHAYIRFLNHVADQLHVFVVVVINRFSGTRASSN
ncbi:receptor-like protein EIX2 [Cajanus cajan]|uniref:receptor-like protein EIX2 n=1 Tax=Cajanus cajan TaxID=3821 RepID=UPI00098DBBA2|nr:receptor-like protein EIX2 [Cajanus cajan]XP_020237354.1 receptor-like protein EIX2 [Cajanus cajan]